MATKTRAKAKRKKTTVTKTARRRKAVRKTIDQKGSSEEGAAPTSGTHQSQADRKGRGQADASQPTGTA
jgi:hypothetical protein